MVGGLPGVADVTPVGLSMPCHLLPDVECHANCHVTDQAMTKEMEEFGLRVPRKVPVTWVGNASEVKLVGGYFCVLAGRFAHPIARMHA